MRDEPIDFLRERNKRRPSAETPTAKHQQQRATREHQQYEMCSHCGCPQERGHELVNKELQVISAATSQKHSLFVICKDQNDYFVRRRAGEIFLLSRSGFPEESLITASSAPPAPINEPNTAASGVSTSAPAVLAPKKELRCSCCERPQGNVRLLIDCERWNIYLCDGCIEVCNEILRDEEISTDALAKPSERKRFSSHRSYSRARYYCSLCGKEYEEVVRLIAMPHDLYICNCCVGICNTAIAQALSDASSETRESTKSAGETMSEQQEEWNSPDFVKSENQEIEHNEN